MDGWKSVIRLLEEVRTDAASAKHRFLAGGGSAWPTLVDTTRRFCILIHLPRTTFLRARDRRERTRLRSSEKPFGLYPADPATIKGNEHLYRVGALIRHTAGFGDTVVISNPPDSYAWCLLDRVLPEQRMVDDIDLTRCMFGAPDRPPSSTCIWLSFSGTAGQDLP